jgi:hypothetical protein
MTRLCQELHCLPNAGGLFDQDSYHVHLMKLVLEADVERANKDADRR